MGRPGKVHGVLLAATLIVGAGAWLLGGKRPSGPSEAQLAQRERLFARLSAELGLSPDQVARVREVFDASPVLGQGNPELSVHPLSPEECAAARSGQPLAAADARCDAPNMVALYDPAAPDGAVTARTCIDQYEFPNIACEYPVVHVRAVEAHALCRAVGKRLCDAHEWEGACAGALRSPDVEYTWGAPREVMRSRHNRDAQVVWAYGPQKDHSLCATQSNKTAGCTGGYAKCGSNTYPSGAFPRCVSRFGVYDQHGNAAEHMNLPLSPEQLASRGRSLGQTEMKGSWFIFSIFQAHEDHCRWRAPDWHGSRVEDPHSHRNYHLGFRCCRDLPAAELR